jgi:putative glutamine amidotransferase
MKPLIGITPTPTIDKAPHGAFYRYALSRTYVDAVRAAGGIPVVIPECETDLPSLFGRLDGLLLSGGGDIDPALFGDSEIHPRTYGIDDERDQFEIDVWHYAAEHDIPALCICRGIQVMSVAQGGSLIQHIPDAVPHSIAHRQHEVGKSRDDLGHDVEIADGSHPLRQIVNQDRLQVNSFHHQAVLTPGNDLEVVATAADGVIEGLWHPGMSFGLGVQWHPEMLASVYPQQAALFEALVDAATKVTSPR